MSSEIIENTKNDQGKQPPNLCELNYDQSKMNNSEYSDGDSVNFREKTIEVTYTPQIESLQEQEKGATDAEKTEESLIKEVNKLDLSLNETDKIIVETAESNNNVGNVVQNKLSDSLSYLQDYNSEEDATDSDDDIAMHGLQFQGLCEESEDSEAESVADDYDSMDDDGNSNHSKPEVSKESQKINASWISDLGGNSNLQIPDISTLELNNKEEFQHIGNIDCILDKFVTIEGLPAMPAYDLDTLFFVEEGQKVLGYVFDVMGPVSSPIYVVHLDSIEKVDILQLKRGTKIYCAPKSKYTKYVFLHELMKIRGSDASWVGDTEVPQEFVEFSDDEEERQKKSLKNKATKRKHSSLERHQQFETNMNKINQLNSRLHNMVDSRNPLRQRINDSKPRTDHSKKSTALDTVPSQWTNQPLHTRQNIPEMPFDGSQSLETYLQNCTSQFLQQWRPRQVNPPGPPQQFYPPEHFYMAPSVPYPAPASGNFVPQFDPSTPPPNYGGPTRCFYPSVPQESFIRVGRPSGQPMPPYADYTPRPTNPVGRHRRKSGPDFRYNTPGPSNGN